MDRHLSLSQAARLIGVTRKDIQKEIQAGNLTVMEGTVTLSDLKNAFPDAQYEDNTMLEKVEKYMRDAVHKMAQSEREGAQVDALSRRLVKMNQELADEHHRADKMEELIDGLKQRLMAINISHDPLHALDDCKDWFHGEVRNLEMERLITPITQMEDQIKQFMLPHVRLLPSRHDFTSDKSETLLESALRSGLAVDYGCNNGKCGKCKAKLLTGQVEKTSHQDYVFSESEKAQGYILTCSNRAITDITLETEEAVSADDIPLQTITAKVKKLQTVKEHVIVMTLRPPRSQRLRFLAGQHVELTLPEKPDAKHSAISAEYSIASCPCEPSTLEFHIPIHDQSQPGQTLLNNIKMNETIELKGPFGSFILDEDSPNSLIFVAWDTGFAPIKSLIEHAMSLENADTIHLYWMTRKVEDHYMENLCRSWNDALDNFIYTPIVLEPRTDVVAESLIKHLHNEHKHLHNFDLYIAAPGHLNHLLKPLLLANGISSENMHFASTFHGNEIGD